MADLDDCADLACDGKQLIRFVERSRDRFFNEDVLAPLQRLLCNLEVRRRGNDDRDGIYVFEQRREVVIRLDAKLRRNSSGALGLLLKESHEICVIDVAQDPDVMKAEAAGANDS